MSSFIKNILSVGALTVVSRILGIFRDIVMAIYLGLGPISDAFFIAFKLPNMLRKLVGEGALQTVFVPEITKKITENNADELQKLINYLWTILLGVLIIFVIIFELIMPQILHYIAPGFRGNAEQLAKMLMMARIIFPYIFFIGIVSFVTSILNSFNKFSKAAVSPIIFNFVLIAMLIINGDVLLNLDINIPMYIMLSFAVVLAGLIQVIWIFMALNNVDLKLNLIKPKLIPEIRRIGRNYVPIVLSSGVYQINIFIDSIFATLVGVGTVSYIYYADRLYQFPIGVMGFAMGAVLLPSLTRLIKLEQIAEAKTLQNKIFAMAFLMTLPVCILLYFCAEPVVETLFQHGSFDAQATINVAHYLRIIAISILFNILLKVTMPIFLANDIVSIIFKIAIFVLIISATMLYILTPIYGMDGIAYTSLFVYFINFITYYAIGWSKKLIKPDWNLLFNLIKIIILNILNVGLIWLWLTYIPFDHNWLTLIKLSWVLGIGIYTYLIYFTVCYIMNLLNIRTFIKKRKL